MTTSATREAELRGAAATQELGRAVGAALAPETAGVLCLSGHLGAGKTTFVKGLAEGLGVAAARDVTSPTFLRMIRFDPPRPGLPTLVHVDAYRMASAADVVELGLDEDLAGRAVVALEWPENVAEALPAERLEVHLEHLGEHARRVRLIARGSHAIAWLTRLGDAAP